jgi:DUF4097 and DUF4098 domain-containing protein YvlB
MKTFDTPGPIVLSLELGVGAVRIVASDRADTVVEVEPSDAAKPADVTAATETSVEYAGGVLRIKGPKGWKHYGFRGVGGSIDVRIEVPSGSRLQCDAGVASVRATGTLGDCRCRTGGGDLTIEQIAGDADFTSGTGEVRVDRIGGSTSVKSGNGDISIGEVVGDLQVKAANGKISIGQARSSATVKTANGDIRLDEVSRGAVVVSTACGKVDVAVRSGVAAWLDLHTGFGQVRNLLDSSDRPDPSEETVEIRARSSFGDVTIRRTERGDTERGAA